MEESRQNAGENVGPGVTPAPEDALEYVLDAWSSEPSTRQRYDRLTLERRDGKSLAVLVDAETARDVADKLTIVAARARHRSRGAAGVPVDRSVDPGNAEDEARARKVFDLAGLENRGLVSTALFGAIVDEFRVSREDVAKAYAMLDEQKAKYVRERAQLIEEQRVRILEMQRAAGEVALRADRAEAELASVKADRANLIAEAAERDIAAGESSIDLTKDESETALGAAVHNGCTKPAICSCQCAACKEAWIAAGRPHVPDGLERYNIHARRSNASDPAFRE